MKNQITYFWTHSNNSWLFIILICRNWFYSNVASFPDVEATTLKKALNYFDKEFPATSTFAINEACYRPSKWSFRLCLTYLP